MLPLDYISTVAWSVLPHNQRSAHLARVHRLRVGTVVQAEEVEGLLLLGGEARRIWALDRSRSLLITLAGKHLVSGMMQGAVNG